MENIFVCIGTNKILTDSFGPRVGEKLQYIFKENPNIKVYGTMTSPIHLKNAPKLSYYLNQTNKNQIILIDSAFGKQEYIGKSFINLGGMKIGNAYGTGFYFPASINIKTVVAAENYLPNWNVEKMDILAQNFSNNIINCLPLC